jgi:hypothetical protein
VVALCAGLWVIAPRFVPRYEFVGMPLVRGDRFTGEVDNWTKSGWQPLSASLVKYQQTVTNADVQNVDDPHLQELYEEGKRRGILDDPDIKPLIKEALRRGMIKE